MRIPCPYCGPRGDEEFTYLGDATVQRPDPAAPRRRRRRSRLRLSARQPGRPAPRALVSRRRLPRVAGGDARHAHPRDQRREVRRRRRHAVSGRIGLPSGGLIDRARPLSFTLRRASVRGLRRRHARLGAAGQRRARWSAARSSITARAASSPPAPRSRTRWSNCAPARGASRTRARPRSSSSTGSTPRARTAGPRSPSTSARSTICSRRSSSRASTTRPSCGRRRSGRSSTSR